MSTATLIKNNSTYHMRIDRRHLSVRTLYAWGEHFGASITTTFISVRNASSHVDNFTQEPQSIHFFSPSIA